MKPPDSSGGDTNANAGITAINAVAGASTEAITAAANAAAAFNTFASTIEEAKLKLEGEIVPGINNDINQLASDKMLEITNHTNAKKNEIDQQAATAVARAMTAFSRVQQLLDPFLALFRQGD